MEKIFDMAVSTASSALNIEQRKQTLKRKLDELLSIKADVQIELKNAESSSGKRRKNEVQNWITNVERITNEVGLMEQEVGLIKWSTALGSRVDKMIEEVEGLAQRGRFERGLVLDAPSVGGDLLLLLTVNMVGQEFQKNMDKILECLANDVKLRISVYGMGGVGKTTLLTHIHNRVKKNRNIFGDVYWVTVSQDFSIYKLQQRIAKAISLDISDEEDELKRAATLAKAFEEKPKFILILDDLWNNFDMEKIGISTTMQACKLFLTTRSLEVCQRVGCQVKIKVEPLSEEEACNLFMEKLNRENPFPREIEDIARCLIRECAGLPLGIIVMASCMREVDDVSEWRNALTELEGCPKIRLEDMENQVFQVLRFSYRRLNDRALEQCFLYCALYPEDYEIKRGRLIEHVIVEGIIEGMESRQKQFDRGHVMLNKLENVCLLEGGNTVEGMKYVKMHDF